MPIARNVLLLVVGIAALQLAIWIPIVRWMKRRSAAAQAALEAEMAASGERTARGPEAGVYRGATGTYSQVKGNCRVVLTDHRLAFVKVTGGRVDVPLEDIAGVRLDEAFLSSIVRGRTHVIVKTHAGDEVGFFAQDHEDWKRAIEHAVEAKRG